MRKTDISHIPDSLTPDGERARRAIVAFLQTRGAIDTGGCTPFYSPQEWKARGEEYGLESVLIVCHDGGDLAPYFNWEYEAYSMMEAMAEILSKDGFFVEQCTSWYSAIYKD